MENVLRRTQKKVKVLKAGIKCLVLAALILGAARGVSGQDMEPEYATRSLDNGLAVIAEYIPESELVTINMRVLSGLSNEGEYAGTGISHFLEHLLFKGTRTKNSDQIRSEIKAMGGVINASTGMDSAAYHITVPNENFLEALELIVSMVMELEFTYEDFENEKNVILKEIRLRNDDPMNKYVRELFSHAYSENVYKYPIIGYEEFLKELTSENLKEYHSRVYKPDRIAIGIAGGIREKEAILASERVSSRYERGRSWAPSVLVEPKQIAQKEAQIPSDVVLGYIAIGFHTTSLYSKDLYSTDVASMLLGEGEDSRLYKKLVKEKELLYSVGSLNYTPRYPGLFIITGIGEPSKLDGAVKEIFNIIEEVKDGRQKIDPKELERAKNIAISRNLHAQEEVSGVASSITSAYLFTSDPAFNDKYVGEVGKVEESDVKEAILKYLTRDNSTIVRLVPRNFSGEKLAEDVSVKAETKEELFSLKNGLKVIIKRRPRLPLVSVIFAVRGGLLSENENNNGISNLTASLFTKGTRERNEDEIVPVFEQMGGSISPFSGMNSMGLGMNVLSKDLNKGMDIFEDVLRNSLFPDDEVGKKKRKILAAIIEKEDNIFENGMKSLKKLLYGNHPYSMMEIGQARTIENISRDDILSYYNEHIHPDNAVLTIVGDVDPSEVYSDILRRFSSWRGMLGTPVGGEELSGLEGIKREDLGMNKEQSLLLLGFRGLEITDDRKEALSVLGSILSGSDGMLFYALREKEGLVYTSGTSSVLAVDPGYFMMYAATTKENLRKTEDILLKVINEVKSGNISEEDITSAKKRLLTSHAYSLEKNTSISMIMTLDELYGLGYEYYRSYPEGIRKVTKDDIIEVANQILDLDKYAEVVIHSEK